MELSLKLHISRLVVIFLTVAILATVIGAPVQAGPLETLTGILIVIQGDQPGSAVTRSSLVLDSGESLALQISPDLQTSAQEWFKLNGQTVEVSGETLPPAEEGGRSYFLVSSVSAVYAISAQDGPYGSQPFVSILCRFSDGTAVSSLWPATRFQQQYDNIYPRLDAYWRETSYNNIDLTGSTVRGWYTLPHPRSYYVYNIDSNDPGNELDFDRAAKDCTALADPTTDFRNFAGINLMFSNDLDDYAWGGKHYLTLDGVSKIWSMTWEPPWGYQNLAPLAHEMGHAFGFPHSAFDRNAVYDNPYDVMSDSWYPANYLGHSDATFGALPQNPIALNLFWAGWIPSNRWVEIANEDPEQVITLERLNTPGASGMLVAIVPIGASSEFYTLEYRQTNSFDRIPKAGLVIHRIDNSGLQDIPAQLVVPSGFAVNTAALTPGMIFEDTAANIRFTVISAAGSSLTVRVANNPLLYTRTPTATRTSTFTPLPPTATRTPTATFTPVPPTATRTAIFTFTPVPPTATRTNTFTPLPPTATRTATATSIPATPPPAALRSAGSVETARVPPTLPGGIPAASGCGWQASSIAPPASRSTRSHASTITPTRATPCGG